MEPASVPVDYPSDLLYLVEEHLATLEFGSQWYAQPLIEAMRHSLLAGGKRIRPVLALATARSLGMDSAAVLPAAAAIELIHTYSLIHDDLPAIDDDTLRRGRPTCHVAYGEDVAILAGDALFAEAFGLLISCPGATAEVSLAAVHEVASATGVQGMVGGQYMDIASMATTDDELRLLHELKTGCLISASVVCGALFAGAHDLAPYRAFAAEIGLLFQIVDDILDEVGEVADLGKSVGKDKEQHKVTYVSRFGMEEAQRLACGAYERALERLAELPGETADLLAVAEYIYRRRH